MKLFCECNFSAINSNLTRTCHIDNNNCRKIKQAKGKSFSRLQRVKWCAYCALWIPRNQRKRNENQNFFVCVARMAFWLEFWFSWFFMIIYFAYFCAVVWIFHTESYRFNTISWLSTRISDYHQNRRKHIMASSHWNVSNRLTCIHSTQLLVIEIGFVVRSHCNSRVYYICMYMVYTTVATVCLAAIFSFKHNPCNKPIINRLDHSLPTKWCRRRHWHCVFHRITSKPVMYSFPFEQKVTRAPRIPTNASSTSRGLYGITWQYM